MVEHSGTAFLKVLLGAKEYLWFIFFLTAPFLPRRQCIAHRRMPFHIEIWYRRLEFNLGILHLSMYRQRSNSSTHIWHRRRIHFRRPSILKTRHLHFRLILLMHKWHIRGAISLLRHNRRWLQYFHCFLLVPHHVLQFLLFWLIVSSYEIDTKKRHQ